MENLQTIGERVAWARKQRQLTQQQLATTAGVAQSTIGSLESGQRSKPRELVSIAKALSASVGWLETGEGEWEATQQSYDSPLEAAFAGAAQASGLAVRKLTRGDAAGMPDWLRYFRGPEGTYVPDFEVRVPGQDHPLYVEVKPKVPGGHVVAGRFFELEKEHPGEFAFFEVDFSQPQLGINRLLQQVHSDLKPANVFHVAERPAAYGMEPILAWEHADDLPEGEFVMIPRLDVHLSAGNGHEQVAIDLVKENPQAFRTEWIRLMKLKPAKLAAMRASGDSMEPTIHDGDSLLVDTAQTNVQDGKVYALWYDGGERVKRLFRLPGGGMRIVSDNRDYPSIEVGPDYPEHVRIIGRIVHRSGVGGL